MLRFSRGGKYNSHAGRHLFCIDAHSMLIILASATMFQFLFSWKQVHAIVLSIRGTFLVLSFLLYVLSRALKRREYHDILVIFAFSAFVVYRVFVENLAASIYGKKCVYESYIANQVVLADYRTIAIHVVHIDSESDIFTVATLVCLGSTSTISYYSVKQGLHSRILRHH